MTNLNVTGPGSISNQFRSKRSVWPVLMLLLSGLIAGVTTWRGLAVLAARGGLILDWLPGGLIILVGLSLFWLAGLYLAGRLAQNLTGPGVLVALLGAGIFGLTGLLLSSPAGLSRLILELQAGQVWSPRMFTATWSGDGLWETPLTLPAGQPQPATLEIVTQARSDSTEPAPVWLVEAAWPDGTTLPLGEFQTESGWTLPELDWQTGQTRPVWVSTQPEAVLRWSGQAPGPLTLVFAQHEQAGQVIVRWNDTPPQTLDLRAAATGLTGITLPLKEPAIWRATLPWSALTQGIGLILDPDPLGGPPAVTIAGIGLTGLPGQPVHAGEETLREALYVAGGQTDLTPAGLRFSPAEPETPLQLFLTGPLAVTSPWPAILPWLENGLLVLHLALLGGIVLAAAGRLIPPGGLVKVNLVLASIMATLVMGEIGLQLYLPPPGRYYVWPPRLHQVFKPSSEIMPGIEGEANFIVNTQGIRGDEFPSQVDYRLLAIGGSTTECLFLDQTEAWPRLLQTRLNQNGLDPGVWVGNVGKAGRTTREHLLQMKYLLPQYRLDAVIMLVGINDFVLRLELGDDYRPDYLAVPGMKQRLLERAFAIFPRQDPDLQPFYRHSAIARLLTRVQQTWQTPAVAEVEIQDENGSNVVRRRQQRQAAAIRDDLPDLAISLAEYRRNLNEIIDLAGRHHIRLILATQPVLWRSDLTPAERDLLWLGWGPEPATYYSVEALAEGIAAYNQTLLEVCRQRRVECVDLASALPQDTTVFYDDVHFNESGSQQVATLLADYLLHHEPVAEHR